MKRNIMPIAIAWKQGWRVLAGPFCDASATDLGLQDETALAEAIISFIEAEGGRAALVATSRCYGVHKDIQCVEIWRPGTEMETIEETQERLRKSKLSK